MPDLQAAREKLSRWIEHHLRNAPPEVRIFYVEWNDGWEDYRLAEKGEPKRKLFSMFGCTGIDPADFDPEDPEMEELLANSNWEPEDCCPLPSDVFENEEPREFFEETIENAKGILPGLSDRVLAYAMHDGGVKAFPRVRKKNWENKRFYYTLHPAGEKNHIDSYEIGDFDEEPLLEHSPVPTWPDSGIRLVLGERPKLFDFLRFYRGWLVCSERVANMLRSATDKIQVFPAPLFRKEETGLQKVEGYFVVVLYEKLDCITEEDVLPPAWEGRQKKLSPGARIKESIVAGRHVFRLNCMYYPLLVSQEFRNQFEREKVTGVQWGRWPIEEPKSRQPAVRSAKSQSSKRTMIT